MTSLLIFFFLFSETFQFVDIYISEVYWKLLYKHECSYKN